MITSSTDDDGRRKQTIPCLSFYNQIRFHKGSTHTQANYQTKDKNLHLILGGNEIQYQGGVWNCLLNRIRAFDSWSPLLIDFISCKVPFFLVVLFGSGSTLYMSFKFCLI